MEECDFKSESRSIVANPCWLVHGFLNTQYFEQVYRQKYDRLTLLYEEMIIIGRVFITWTKDCFKTIKHQDQVKINLLCDLRSYNSAQGYVLMGHQCWCILLLNHQISSLKIKVVHNNGLHSNILAKIHIRNTNIIGFGFYL